MRNVSRFQIYLPQVLRLKKEVPLRPHTVTAKSSLWCSINEDCDNALQLEVQARVVLLCKLRCILFLTVFTGSLSNYICSFNNKSDSLISISQVIFKVPCTNTKVLHSLPYQTVFDFLSERHSKLSGFISDITNIQRSVLWII